MRFVETSIPLQQLPGWALYDSVYKRIQFIAGNHHCKNPDVTAEDGVAAENWTRWWFRERSVHPNLYEHLKTYLRVLSGNDKVAYHSRFTAVRRLLHDEFSNDAPEDQNVKVQNFNDLWRRWAPADAEMGTTLDDTAGVSDPGRSRLPGRSLQIL